MGDVKRETWCVMREMRRLKRAVKKMLATMVIRATIGKYEY
jgi:hypothetical protein